MNERIRELAREAAGGLLSYNAEGEFRLSEKELEKFAELIAAEEREACAAICDEGCSYDGDIIRARGGK